VATEDFYKRYWLPKTLKEDLYYLSQLKTGIPVNKENIDSIIEELGILANKIPSDGSIDDEVKEFWLVRLNHLVSTLQQKRNDDYLDAFLG